jgi:hypothetical protein
MGRPPIGKKPLTRTEIQRRWRQKRRQQGLRRSGPELPAPSRSDTGIQPASDQAADRERIEEHAPVGPSSPQCSAAMSASMRCARSPTRSSPEKRNEVAVYLRRLIS